MSEKEKIKVSVRNLVEFVLKYGDLDSRFMGGSRALEGTRAHQKIQKSYNENYSKEVTLKYEIEYDNYLLSVEGRADGIFKDDEKVIIDEIKTITCDINEVDEDYNLLHFAQAKCYAYIYATQNNIEELEVQLTYYQLDTEEIKYIKKQFTFSELKNFFFEVLKMYSIWLELTYKHKIKRDSSIEELQFPFTQYRKGQRELSVAVYRTITQNKKIFISAPTGIGKTISTIFPAIKALGKGQTSKIFYLTAKTITAKVAEEGILKLKKNGLYLKNITITAKSKICFEKEASCNPDSCEYARGYFDRANEAIYDILNHENELNRETIEKYALKYEICPFEFSLDLTLWCDCIIGDYNYVFDPRVNLKRFFAENNGDYCFLIDEAHNLVDRSREMFSSELNKRDFLNVKRYFKLKSPRLYKALGKVSSYILNLSKTSEEQSFILNVEPTEIYPLIAKVTKEAEEILIKNEKEEGIEELLELYFNCLNYIRISELYDERYVTYLTREDQDTKIKLFCLDPSYLLSEALKRGKSAVFFSATLSPMNYFKEILGGASDDYNIRLESPFDKEKMNLIIADNISTRYKNRESTYGIIINYIYNFITAKKGNYLVFFPSYTYMIKVHNEFIEKYSNIKVILQSNAMEEKDREAFLETFEAQEEEYLIGFTVMGGIFSEGIDLIGNRLIGAVIIGVGLPQICFERDIIMNYFKKKNNFGYEYSYMYPGMNKVLQAAGRVIRTEQDKGAILLIDDRYTTQSYINIMPTQWRNFHKSRNVKQMEEFLNVFWNV